MTPLERLAVSAVERGLTSGDAVPTEEIRAMVEAEGGAVEGRALFHARERVHQALWQVHIFGARCLEPHGFESLGQRAPDECRVCGREPKHPKHTGGQG